MTLQSQNAFCLKLYDDEQEVLNEGKYRADADVDDVPEPNEFVVKNTATLALQLHKRFRNIQFSDYDGRIAPSILLSHYAAAAARANTSLTDMVIRQASFMITEIENASLYGRLISVSNPCHELDVFTDRWPERISQQDDYANKLKEMVAGLAGKGCLVTCFVRIARLHSDMLCVFYGRQRVTFKYGSQ